MADWQTIAVAIALAAAVAYLTARAVRAWRGRAAGCGGGCKCAPQEPKGLISADDLLRRVRGPQ